jgi:hypothetical protein
LESGGYSRRTPTGALHHHPRDGAAKFDTKFMEQFLARRS